MRRRFARSLRKEGGGGGGGEAETGGRFGRNRHLSLIWGRFHRCPAFVPHLACVDILGTMPHKINENTKTRHFQVYTVHFNKRGADGGGQGAKGQAPEGGTRERRPCWASQTVRSYRPTFGFRTEHLPCVRVSGGGGNLFKTTTQAMRQADMGAHFVHGSAAEKGLGGGTGRGGGPLGGGKGRGGPSLGGG